MAAAARAPRAAVVPPEETACAIEIVGDRAAFDALQEDWTALFERVGRPSLLFQSHKWLACWLDHYFDPSMRLVVIVGRRRGRVAMIWPLVARKTMGLVRLEWMGDPVGQYGDALVEIGRETQTDLLKGWRAASRAGADFILLRKVRAESPLAALLAQVAHPCENQAAPYALLGAGERPDCGKARSDRRRMMRRLGEAGEVSFAAGVRAAAAAAWVREAFVMKQAWARNGRIVSRTLDDGAMSAFFDDFTRRSGPPDVVTDAILLNGAAVAVGVTLVCGPWAFGHILARDPALARHGLGILLADQVMASYARLGLERYDMLAPFDPYKRAWASGADGVADYVVGLSPIGRCAARVWRSGARAKARRLLIKTPPFLRTVIGPLARRLAGVF